MGKASKQQVIFGGGDKMGLLLPICAICGQVPHKGLAEGICICGSFICSACEQEMLHNSSYDEKALRSLAVKLK